jgi:hypothetical protein
LYEKLEVNSRPKLLPSASESAAAESAKAAATKSSASEAIAAKSATPEPIAPEITATKAAALEVLEALAGKITTRAVLRFAIQVLGPTCTIGSVEAACAARSIQTAFASSAGTAYVGTVGASG